MAVWTLLPFRKCNRILILLATLGVIWNQIRIIERISFAQSLEQKLDDISEKNRDFVNEIGILTRRLNSASQDWAEAKTSIKELGRGGYKARSLVLWGVGESNGEDKEEWVIDLLGKFLNARIEAKDLESYRRIGIRSLAAPRPLLLELSSAVIKKNLMLAISSQHLYPIFASDDVIEDYDVTDKSCTMNIKSIGAATEIATVGGPFGAVIKHTSYIDDVTRDDVLNTTIIRRTPDPRVWIARRDSGNRDLLEYRSAEDLRKGVVPIANYTLPYPWYGTGHVIVSGCLIYVRSRTNFLVKYDLQLRTMVRYRQLKHAKHGEPGSDNEGCPYESGHHSEITLQADEFGVWATYCSSSGSSNMMLALIDVDTLKVIKEWDTGWRKNFFEAMFVACGVVYAIRKFESRPHLQIKYAFNTISSIALKSPTSLSSSVGVDKSYGRISQLTYDHVDKQLLIWTRRGNLLTLPVNFDYYTHDRFR